MHTLAGHRGSRQGKRKSAYTSRTPKPPPQDAFLRQKVYTLGSPRFALFRMHTRLSRFCGRLRKSAYTRRTPQRQPQPAKSVHTSLPRVLYKKYAYYPDTIRQKVHTLAGHRKTILPAKSVHPSQPPGWQTPPPHSGRRNLAERLSRGFWPASLLFLPFFAPFFWFCRPRSGRLPRFCAYFTRGSS